jgi:uncharacterized protein DUF4259
MSIWGPGPAQNDDAADWLSDLADAPDLETVRAAIVEIADPAHAGYREVTECCEAIAAAQILCDLLGEPGSELILDFEEADTAALRESLQRLSVRDKRKLVGQAVFSVDFVANDSENSELRQLWEEDEIGLREWLTLTERLRGELERLSTI